MKGRFIHHSLSAVTGIIGTFFKSVIALLAAVSSCACSGRGVNEMRPETGMLTLLPCVYDMVQTRSRLNVPENRLSSAAVAVYDAEGGFVRSVNATDVAAIYIPHLIVGKEYHVYAAFNAGDLNFPLSESDIGTVPLTWDAAGIGADGFPMVWTGTVNLTSEAQNVEMEAVRLVSKIVFSVSDSALTDHNGAFSVSSVALKNSVRTISVFAASQTPMGEAGYSSDSADAADIISVNAGDAISFYTFENPGGCPASLSGNTDPWRKVPDSVSGDGTEYTYLEVEGTYSTDWGTASAPVTYRMYLGANATDDFNLLRNSIYDVTLVPSDEGIGRASWKITRGSFSDSRSLAFTPESITMNLNTDTTFTVTPTPSDMVFTVEEGTDFESSTLTLVPAGSPGEYRLIGSGSLIKDAVTSVVATSWDGRVTAILPVTVKAKILKHITLTPASMTKFTGDTQSYTVTATYDESGTYVDYDVTAEAEFESDNPEVAVMGTGPDHNVATAVNGGAATIIAHFGGMEASAQFHTRYPVRLKVDCDGYQSGSGTAPVWKIDWVKVRNNPTYTVTAVYSDGTEKTDFLGSPIAQLCTASQTYVAGTAGEGNCFDFNDGVITQKASGDVDTGGNGTLTLTYTEAGKAVDITVEWWKLYIAYVYGDWYYTALGGFWLPYGENRVCRFADAEYTAVYNDGTQESDGLEIKRAEFTNVRFADPSFTYYAALTVNGWTGFTISALRPADVDIIGDPVVTYRRAPLKATFKCRRSITLSAGSGTYMAPRMYCDAGTDYLYCVSRDIDGWYSCQGAQLILQKGPQGAGTFSLPTRGCDIWNSIGTTSQQTYDAYVRAATGEAAGYVHVGTMTVAKK